MLLFLNLFPSTVPTCSSIQKNMKKLWLKQLKHCFSILLRKPKLQLVQTQRNGLSESLFKLASKHWVNCSCLQLEICTWKVVSDFIPRFRKASSKLTTTWTSGDSWNSGNMWHKMWVNIVLQHCGSTNEEFEEWQQQQPPILSILYHVVQTLPMSTASSTWGFPQMGVPLNHPFEWDFPL